MRTHQMEPIFSQPYCDLGAQYLTVGQDYSIGKEYIQSLYSLLQSNSILTPLFLAPSLVPSTEDGGEGSSRVKPIDGMKPDHLLKQHFIAPKGTASIVSFLATYHHQNHQSSDISSPIRYSTKLLRMSIEGSRVRVTGGLTACESVEPSPMEEELFDVVVLTAPAPQLLQLDAPQLLDRRISSNQTLRQRLQRVRYSSRLVSTEFFVHHIHVSIHCVVSLSASDVVHRYAMAAYYDMGSRTAVEELLTAIPWRAKYVFDDDIVRYISIENYKFEGP